MFSKVAYHDVRMMSLLVVITVSLFSVWFLCCVCVCVCVYTVKHCCLCGVLCRLCSSSGKRYHRCEGGRRNSVRAQGCWSRGSSRRYDNISRVYKYMYMCVVYVYVCRVSHHTDVCRGVAGSTLESVRAAAEYAIGNMGN